LSQTRYALPQFIKRPYAYAHRKKTSDGSHYEKRGKGEPVCIDDEIPFEIPDSWEWVRLETAYNFIDYRGKTPIKSSDGIRLMTASNVRQGFIDYSREEYISEAEYESRQSRGITHKGDILFTTEAPMGYCALNEMDVCSCGQRVITFQNYYHDALNNALFCQFILSPAFQAQISDNATGTTAKGIKAARLKDLLLPIPPQNEQKRINERIVSLSPIVNDYGNLEDAREHLDAELPDRLRKSVLQLAVQGKLVPQDPADEPASVLLDRIRAERAKLIKGKKLKAPKGGESVIYRASDGGYYEKRGKGVPVCIDNEIPFEIPESWEWVRLGSILELVSDGTHKTPEYKESGVLFLSVQNISKGYFDLSKVKYISRETHDELCKRVKPQNRDILLCRIGTLGKPIIVDVDYEFSIFVSLGLLRLIDSRLAEWVVDCIDAPIGFQWIQRVKVGGGTHTFKINLGDIPEFLIPLPPLNEQRRILNRCKALFSSAG